MSQVVPEDRDHVAEILDLSASILDAQGWCQQTEENDKGQFCALGAVREAVDRLKYRGTWYQDVWWATHRLAEQVSEPDAPLVTYTYVANTSVDSLAVVRWNDDHRRTREDVTAAMQKAAAKARELVADE